MNRSMAAKYDKAKKCAIQEISENAKAEMCCKSRTKNHYNQISLHSNVYSQAYANDIFYSKHAIQRRIDVLMGRHYPANKFRDKFPEIYEFLTAHTVPEVKQYFGDKLY